MSDRSNKSINKYNNKLVTPSPRFTSDNQKHLFDLNVSAIHHAEDSDQEENILTSNNKYVDVENFVNVIEKHDNISNKNQNNIYNNNIINNKIALSLINTEAGKQFFSNYVQTKDNIVVLGNHVPKTPTSDKSTLSNRIKNTNDLKQIINIPSLKFKDIKCETNREIFSNSNRNIIKITETASSSRKNLHKSSNIN